MLNYISVYEEHRHFNSFIQQFQMSDMLKRPVSLLFLKPVMDQYNRMNHNKHVKYNINE